MIGVLALGCNGAEPSSRKAPAPERERTTPMTTAPSPEQITVRKAPQTPEYVKKAVEAASKASAKAEESGATDANPPSTCARAYLSLSATVATLRKEEAPGAPRAMAPKAKFFRVCESLPDEAQACLVVDYAVDHQNHCRNVESRLALKERQALAGLLAAPPESKITKGPNGQ